MALNLLIYGDESSRALDPEVHLPVWNWLPWGDGVCP